jgi:hypothetical protein
MDLSLLQPISQFAAAIGVCVAAVYYVMNLRISQRNQELSLKTQELALKAQEQSLISRQAQLFMGIYQHSYSHEHSVNEYTLNHREVKDIKDWKSHLDDLDFCVAFVDYHGYFEGMGILVKEKLVDIRLVTLMVSGPVRWFWERYRSLAAEVRIEYDWPRFMIEVEYLYNALNEYADCNPELQVATPKDMKPQGDL